MDRTICTRLNNEKNMFLKSLYSKIMQFINMYNYTRNKHQYWAQMELVPHINYWIENKIIYLPLKRNKKPISRDAIGYLFHFPIQWLAMFYLSHFLGELQQMETGPAPQTDTKLQLSMPIKSRCQSEEKPKTRITWHYLHELCLLVLRIYRGYTPLQVSQLS